jgi:hypothetical protein
LLGSSIIGAPTVKIFLLMNFPGYGAQIV